MRGSAHRGLCAETVTRHARARDSRCAKAGTRAFQLFFARGRRFGAGLAAFSSASAFAALYASTTFDGIRPLPDSP
jgi:hypothetical protein